VGRNKDASEKPTAKRLKEARRDGQIARTPEVGQWAGVLVATWLIPKVIADLFDSSEGLLRRISSFIARPDPGAAMTLLNDALTDGALAVAPLLVGIILTVLVSAGVQGGLRPSAKLLKPKFSRLNPVAGLKRLLGPKSWWEAAKTVVKTAVLGLVLYLAVRDLVPTVMGSGALPVTALVEVVHGSVLSLIRSAAIAGLVMAVADYVVVRRRTGKELLMTKQQVKDEHKSTEGDPHVKGQIRARQFAMSRNRMMSEVAGADVVLTNPTHVAVALRYDAAKGAPRVVAKGAGVIAAKIRALAAEHRVPVVQDVPLARALYKACELGQEIPADLFGPVAHVLAFLYRLRRKGSAAGTHRLGASSPAVAG
jgi:flagellar biosynthetic protein FlhB